MESEGNKRINSIIAGAIVLGAIFYAGFYTGLNSHPPIGQIITLENKESDKPVKVDFSPFWKTWNVLNEKFVSSKVTTTASMTDEDKVWGAIEGLANSVKDPYTVFLPPDINKLFESEIAGNFEGVGMEIGIKDDLLTVIAPLKDTPAEKAGVLSGDKIIKIDDTSTSGMRVDQAVKLIRGKRGTVVRLTMVREGKKEPLEIKVTRDIINIPTIEKGVKKITSGGATAKDTGLLEGGVYVIKLFSFSEPSPYLFRDALREFLNTDSDELIIDLRGNPGGYLDAAVDIASWFLPVGKVVVTEDFGQKAESRVYRSFGYDIVKRFRPNLKVAILINNGSASASEILAGALKEYHKATVIGGKSFGKGSVQELVKITPDTSLKVTVARWLTPNGNSISEVGVTPDIEVKVTPDDIEKGKDLILDRAIKFLNTGK